MFTPPTIEQESFKRFWDAYPKRNGKKKGKYPCGLWFKAYTPNPETVQGMIDWLTTDKANRRYLGKKGKFYASLPDPIRFLKDKMWEDGIESVVKKKKEDICQFCGKSGTVKVDGKGWACCRCSDKLG